MFPLSLPAFRSKRDGGRYSLCRRGMPPQIAASEPLRSKLLPRMPQPLDVPHPFGELLAQDPPPGSVVAKRCARGYVNVRRRVIDAPVGLLISLKYVVHAEVLVHNKSEK